MTNFQTAQNLSLFKGATIVYYYPLSYQCYLGASICVIKRVPTCVAYYAMVNEGDLTVDLLDRSWLAVPSAFVQLMPKF